jgi:N4-gp56 family major capsid protein
VEIDYVSKAVVAEDKMSLKRPAFDLRKQFRDAIVDWLSEYKDRKTLETLSTSPSSNRRVFPGTATSEATLTNTDTFSTSVISKAKRKAQLSTPKIRPIIIKGKSYYVMLVHQYQLKALKAESAWQQAVREADVRGRDNPMFSGADFYWDGVFLFEYERVLTKLAGEEFEAGDTCAVNTARALLLGAQAGCQVYGQLPQWHEKLFQYNTLPGVMVDMIWATAKTVFNSEDFGVITVDTYYAED